MVVVLLVSGTQMLMLGVIGEYLWRNLDETRKRPPYIIAQTIKAPGAQRPADTPDGTQTNPVTKDQADSEEI
jgi:hypothetical protein